MERIRVFLVDEQRVFVDALELSLDGVANVAVVGNAGPDDDALAALRQAQPDVVIIDVGAGGEAVEALATRFAALAPSASLLVLTAVDDPDLAIRAAAAGFDGWVSKDSSIDHLLEVLDAVCRGQVSYPPAYVTAMVHLLRAERGKSEPRHRLIRALSARELDVLAAMVDGANSVQIAERLHLSRNTVRTHMRHVFRKLNAHSALEVVKIARRAGIEPVAATPRGARRP